MRIVTYNLEKDENDMPMLVKESSQNCPRRTDVKLGWDQPELPWHHNQDITRNISGNMIHTDDTVGVIHDYQTASPVLIIKDKSCFGSEEDGVGTIYIPIKFCPECGRKLGRQSI